MCGCDVRTVDITIASDDMRCERHLHLLHPLHHVLVVEAKVLKEVVQLLRTGMEVYRRILLDGGHNWRGRCGTLEHIQDGFGLYLEGGNATLVLTQLVVILTLSASSLDSYLGEGLAQDFVGLFTVNGEASVNLARQVLAHRLDDRLQLRFHMLGVCSLDVGSSFGDVLLLVAVSLDSDGESFTSTVGNGLEHVNLQEK